MNSNYEPPISRREIQVLSYVAKGNSSKQIAGILGISVNTVNNQRRSMLRKTESKNMAELLTRYADFLK